MLLVYIVLIVLITLTLALLLRDRGSLFTFLTALSLGEFLFFVLLFIAKHRGFERRMILMFFLTPRIDQRMQYTIMLLSQLGYGMAVGRCLFPLFLLMLAAEHSALLSGRSMRGAYLPASILPALSLVGYLRPVFEWISRLSPLAQRLFVQFSFFWCLAYTLLAVGLCVFELASVSIPPVRRRYLKKVMMLLGFAGVYLLYCRQDPAQAYMFYHDSYMSGLGLWYLSPIMSYGAHVVLIALIFACTATSAVYTVRVGLAGIRLQADNRSIRQKFDMARHGGNVFVHGIKNQLLAGRALCRRMEAEAADGRADLAALRGDIARMQGVVDAMMRHVDSLYRSFREPSLRFAATSAEAVIRKALEAVRAKYPRARVRLGSIGGYALVADEDYLSEALANLITNAWEANLQAGRGDADVGVRCYPSSAYVVIEVSDRGEGVPKGRRRAVFEPFYTEKNTSQNWGMGLYLSRMIVRRHFGQLELSSRLGRGTTLYMMLPAHRGGKERSA